MIQSIKKIIAIFLLVSVFTSCNQGPTLQSYYVDHELKPGFMTFDAPKSFINIEGVNLTKAQKEAYDSVDKLNILAFTTTNSSEVEFKTELEKINTILKDSKYEELIRGGNASDGKFSVKFLGEVDDIDELILFGSANDQGFVVARVLGDHMNAKKLISLASVLDKAKIDDSQLQKLTEIFKP